MEAPELQLKSIFNEALDRPKGPARTGYLDEACGGDERLRRQVEGLLAAHEQAGAFLKTAAPAAQVFDVPPGPTIDQPSLEKPRATRSALTSFWSRLAKAASGSSLWLSSNSPCDARWR
jgi:hypothetical protein